MGKEYFITFICVFLFCLSADYFLDMHLSLSASKNANIKAILGCLGVSLGLSVVLLLIFKLVLWMFQSVIGAIVVLIAGVALIIGVPLLLIYGTLIPGDK